MAVKRFSCASESSGSMRLHRLPETCAAPFYPGSQGLCCWFDVNSVAAYCTPIILRSSISCYPKSPLFIDLFVSPSISYHSPISSSRSFRVQLFLGSMRPDFTDKPCSASELAKRHSMPSIRTHVSRDPETLSVSKPLSPVRRRG